MQPIKFVCARSPQQLHVRLMQLIENQKDARDAGMIEEVEEAALRILVVTGRFNPDEVEARYPDRPLQERYGAVAESLWVCGLRDSPDCRRIGENHG